MFCHHTLYIRNRIVQWAFGPRIRNYGSRCTDVVLKIIQTMTYVGFDVSKATFVIAYSSVKTNKTRTFKNTVKGVHEFIQTISPATHHCVLEAHRQLQCVVRLPAFRIWHYRQPSPPLKIKNFTRVMRRTRLMPV